MDLKDKSNEKAFVAFFKTLEQNESNLWRIFANNQSDQFTIPGELASEACQVIYGTNRLIKYLGGDVTSGLPVLVLGKPQLSKLLSNKATEARVEVWSNTGLGGNQNWKVIVQSSPGNLEPILPYLDSSEAVLAHPTILAVKVNPPTISKASSVSVCFLDHPTATINLSEFDDNDIFSNLESVVVQTGCQECLLPESCVADPMYRPLLAMLSRAQVLLTPLKSSLFNSTSVESDLSKLIDSDVPLLARPEMALTHALAPCSALIKYLKLVEALELAPSFQLKRYDLAQFMRLDRAATTALNLFPTPGQPRQLSSSVLGLLNNCSTKQGSLLLTQFLHQPLINRSDIEQRLDLVEAFVNDPQLLNQLRAGVLRFIPDLSALNRKFAKGKAGLQDVVRVYQAIQKLPELIEALETSQNPELLELAYTNKIKEYHVSCSKLAELVETTVDLDATARHEYKIRSDFDDGLSELNESMEAINNAIRPEVARVANMLNLELDKKLKQENSPIYGQCLRVSRIEASCLRHHHSDIIELSTQKAGVYFTTKRLKSLDEKSRDLKKQYQSAQTTLVKEVLSIVDSYSSYLLLLNGLVAHLDVMGSMAFLATNSPKAYVRPQFSEDDARKLILKQARHPCIEVQPNVSFIANDVHLDSDGKHFAIITGPNMGGKSTYIRQIGVIAVMAQIGSFVPCDEATLPLFDQVLARVGANDAQHKGISTFMAEMLETGSILKIATKNSLVVIDELGRGTSTYDGYGLAHSISQHLLDQIGATTLFATHFHELTALANTYPQVTNLKVSVLAPENGQGVTLLYHVIEGISDQSFGIHVARMAKFPELLVELATRKVRQLQQDSNEDRPYHEMKLEDLPSAKKIKEQMKQWLEL